MNVPGEERRRNVGWGFRVRICLAIIGFIGAMGVFVLRLFEPKPITQAEIGPASMSAPANQPQPAPDERMGPAVETPAQTGPIPTLPTGSLNSGIPGPNSKLPMPPVSLPTPTPESLQLVNSLCKLDTAAGPMTLERVAEWKQNFEQLLGSGPMAVSAILEFLKQNTELAFEGEVGKLLGYGSARIAMLDALGRIGGPEAVSAMSQVLQTAAVPREIALLARGLDSLAPEQYRQAAVDAARQTLAMAGEKNLEGFDVAPLFEVLQKYGGANALPDLEQASSEWKYYAAIALADLPDGAGLPTLINMTRTGPGGAHNAALEGLTQLAGANSVAQTVLVDLARANSIGPSMWAYLEPLLGGNQLFLQDSTLNDQLQVFQGTKLSSAHIPSSNQNFFYAPPAGGLSADQVHQQLVLVNALRSATTDPNALQVLDRTDARLQQRLLVVNAQTTASGQ